jgi:polysaccharide biosynthesis transport protein
VELTFVLTALRRRWWVIIIGALLGIALGLRISPPAESFYRSDAVLLISPPTMVGGNVFTGNPDRYVAGQLSVLTSVSLANAVAESVGDGASAAGMLASTTVSQQPDSDVVVIESAADTPERAQQIAQSFVDQYLLIQGQGVADSQQDEIEALDQRLTQIQAAIDETNAELAAAAAPYIRALDGPNPQPVPDPYLLNPAAATQRDQLLAEFGQIQAARNELEVRRLRVNSQMIQRATLPEAPITENNTLYVSAGLLVGLLLGVAAAMIWARSSSKLLDEVAVEELIGIPVVGELPRRRSLRGQPYRAFEELPAPLFPTIDQLCVRAEAMAEMGKALRVAVVGTHRGAGTTTTALAMAHRFAQAGLSVVLIDADVRSPYVTEAFGADRSGGVASMLRGDDPRAAFTASEDPNVEILGLGDRPSSVILRRDAVPSLLDGAGARSQVVIVDGGPLLQSASSVQLCHLVDAVVLTIPLADQRADELEDVVRQLEEVRDRVLPVITSPSGRAASRSTTDRPPTDQTGRADRSAPAAADVEAVTSSGSARRSRARAVDGAPAPSVRRVGTTEG